jgi:nucleoside-diphosphate-sugar epimerase
MTSSAPQPTSSSYWANRTVVVTGGNGFLGTKVVAKLRRAGATVVAPRQSEADLTQVGVALVITRLLQHSCISTTS